MYSKCKRDWVTTTMIWNVGNLPRILSSCYMGINCITDVFGTLHETYSEHSVASLFEHLTKHTITINSMNIRRTLCKVVIGTLHHSAWHTQILCLVVYSIVVPKVFFGTTQDRRLSPFAQNAERYAWMFEHCMTHMTFKKLSTDGLCALNFVYFTRTEILQNMFQ